MSYKVAANSITAQRRADQRRTTPRAIATVLCPQCGSKASQCKRDLLWECWRTRCGWRGVAA